MGTMESLGLTIAECGPFWKDPIHMRSNCVRTLRLALRQWANEIKSKNKQMILNTFKALVVEEFFSLEKLQTSFVCFVYLIAASDLQDGFIYYSKDGH